MGNHQRAARCYQQARVHWQQYGDPYYEANSLIRLGENHHATGDSGAAQESWREALSLLEQVSHPDAARVRAMLDGLTLSQ